MSSIGSCAAPSSREPAAQAGMLVCAFIAALFVFAATLAAARKDVSQFDEMAHVSYVAHMQRADARRLVLGQMRMLDPATFRVTGAANYLNHPRPFYVLLAWLGPKLDGAPGALLAHRLINIALAAVGLGALLAIGLIARLPRYELYAYAIPRACIPGAGRAALARTKVRNPRRILYERPCLSSPRTRIRPSRPSPTG